MHLQMQPDVWLDTVINLQQYILRYTSPNENFRIQLSPNNTQLVN